VEEKEREGNDGEVEDLHIGFSVWFLTKRWLRMMLIFKELVCVVLWWGWSVVGFLNDWRNLGGKGHG